jgi:hypothetical protein
MFNFKLWNRKSELEVPNPQDEIETVCSEIQKAAEVDDLEPPKPDYLRAPKKAAHRKKSLKHKKMHKKTAGKEKEIKNLLKRKS